MNNLPEHVNSGTRFDKRLQQQMSDINADQTRRKARQTHLTLHTHFTLNFNASRQVLEHSYPPSACLIDLGFLDSFCVANWGCFNLMQTFFFHPFSFFHFR